MPEGWLLEDNTGLILLEDGSDFIETTEPPTSGTGSLTLSGSGTMAPLQSWATEVLNRAPIVWWQFTETGSPGTNQTAVDSSGNGRHGLAQFTYHGEAAVAPNLTGPQSLRNVDDSSRVFLNHASWMDVSAVTAIVIAKGAFANLGTLMAVDDVGNTTQLSWRLRKLANGGVEGFYRGGGGISAGPVVTGVLIDSSSNGRNGTFAVAAPTSVAGLTGDGDKALQFAGGSTSSALARVEDAPWMDASSFTVLATVKCTNFSSGSGTQTIAGRYNGSVFASASFVLRFDNASGGRLTGYIFSGGTFGSAQQALTLTVNQTYDVAMTYNGSTITLYLDGASVATGTQGSMNNSSEPFTIGNSGAGGSEGFSGVIDEVAYFGSVLTAGQISALRTTRLAGSGYPAAVNALSPLAYYRLNETPAMTANTLPGVPFMAAYSLSASSQRLYLNGGRVASGGTPVAPPVGTGALRVMALNTNAEIAQGSFDEAILFDYVLSDADHAALYAAAFLSQTPPPTTGTGSLSLSGSAGGGGRAGASGSLTLSGSGGVSTVASATGSLDLTGSSVTTASITASASLSLAAIAELTNARTGTATLTLSGTALTSSSSIATGFLSLAGSMVPVIGSGPATGALSLAGSGGARGRAAATGAISLSLIAAVTRTGTALLTMSASGSVVIVISQTLTFQGATELTVSHEDYTFLGELRLEILNDQIDRAPSSVTVTLVGAQSQTNVTFLIDSTPVYTVQTGSDGTLGPTSLNLTTTLGTLGAHTVSAIQGTVSDTQGFTVLRAPSPYPIVAGFDAPPVIVTGALTTEGNAVVRHWVFQDLLAESEGGIGSYVFPHNPRQMTSPHLEHAMATKPTTSVTEGQVHIFQAGAIPKEWQFSGYCPSQAHQEAILRYRYLNRRFYIIDHRNRAWKAVITEAEFVPRLQQVYNGVPTDWGSDFTITAVVLDQNWSTPV